MDEEDISAANFTIDEASTNFTVPPFDEIDILVFNALGFSFLFGVPTNAYVIWLIITGAGSGVASEIFILNFSVCGIFYSLGSLLNVFIILLSFQSPSLLVLTWFLSDLAITGSPLFQCLICVERYLAVVHPVTFLKYKPLRYRVICCTVAWIITLASCIIYSTCIYHLYVQMLFLLLQLIPCLTIKLFCSLAVLRALKQSGPGDREKEREEENHMKTKAFYLILITTVTTVITYVPFTLNALFFIVTEHYFHVFSLVSNVCFMLTGFVPPVLYLHRVGKLSCLSICNIMSYLSLCHCPFIEM